MAGKIFIKRNFKVIDYEKLKLAHELAMNLNNYCIEIVLGVGDQAALFLRYTDDNGDSPKLNFMKSIDDLITRLKELTQPKPKYEVGQDVYVLRRQGICGLMAGKLQKYKEKPGIYYAVFDGFGGYWLREEEIYPTREALIDAQIEYWESLKH